MGLREEILKAKSKKEIETLLEIGSKFKYVSKKTIKSWINTKKVKYIEFDMKNKNVKKKIKK